LVGDNGTKGEKPLFPDGHQKGGGVVPNTKKAKTASRAVRTKRS